MRIHVADVDLNVVVHGHGTPLVLVHGFPLDHTMWQRQIDGLADSHQIIAVDLRGFGQSGVTPGTLTMEHFADDLAILLEELKIEERVSFCGLSMGGYIAWEFWRRHRDHLARLILCDTRAAADSDTVARARRQTAHDVLQNGPQTLADGMIPKLFSQTTIDTQPEVIESIRKVMLETDPESIAGALCGMAERHDFSGELDQIDVPTLVICGEHDAISTADEMRGFANQIPDAQYVEVPNAGHMAPLENPDFVNDAIDDFLM